VSELSPSKTSSNFKSSLGPPPHAEVLAPTQQQLEEALHHGKIHRVRGLGSCGNGRGWWDDGMMGWQGMMAGYSLVEIDCWMSCFLEQGLATCIGDYDLRCSKWIWRIGNMLRPWAGWGTTMLFQRSSCWKPYTTVCDGWCTIPGSSKSIRLVLGKKLLRPGIDGDSYPY
jgi:hypothetical protein